MAFSKCKQGKYKRLQELYFWKKLVTVESYHLIQFERINPDISLM